MAEITNGGANLSAIKEAVIEGAEKVANFKVERKALNDEIAAVRANLETLGIKKEAFDMALKYSGWDEDKREGFDLAYDIVREALGSPVKAQGDLLNWAEEKKKRKEQAKAERQAKKEAEKEAE